MKHENFPNLMIIENLLSPIDRSIEKLNGISTHIVDLKSEVMVQGLFVMAVSTMEVMISDILEYFLRSFPKKLTTVEFKFEKDIFLNNYFTLVRKAAESHIIGLSYKSFEEYFNKTLEHLSVEWPDFFETYGNDIKEIRATRNLLLHNDLIVNDQYLDTAGSKMRATFRDGKLKVDNLYLKSTVNTLLTFEEQFKLKLSSKESTF